MHRMQIIEAAVLIPIVYAFVTLLIAFEVKLRS